MEDGEREKGRGTELGIKCKCGMNEGHMREWDT